MRFPEGVKQGGAVGKCCERVVKNSALVSGVTGCSAAMTARAPACRNAEVRP